MVLVISPPNGIGFALGSVIVAGLGIMREQYYKVMLNDTDFKKTSYFRYIFFLFFLLWAPLGLAFYFPNIIGPFGYAAAIIYDRMALYVIGLFSERRGVEE